MTAYQDRQKWDYGTWPEFDEQLGVLQRLVFGSPPGVELNLMVFTVASQASGCLHCQAHGSFGLHHLAGASLEKVRALWSFPDSELFSDRERAALRFGFAAGQSPCGVTPEHHADLRALFSDEEVRTLIRTVALSGLMNRFNDSLAVVTDATARDWAMDNLADLGWEIGKHAGADHERRPDLPIG